MTTRNRAAALAFALFASSMPAWVGAAEAPPIEPPSPLTVPTPAAPKLRMPQMAPPPASMMLDQIRPLQVPQRSERPTLNRFPDAEVQSDDEGEGEASGPRFGPGSEFHLQHR